MWLFCCSLLSSESMAGPRVSQFSGQSCWKKWWKRSPNTCCSKKILLLLVWQMLFFLSWRLLIYIPTGNVVVLFISTFLSCTFAPLIGWLADVRFGRYDELERWLIVTLMRPVQYHC